MTDKDYERFGAFICERRDWTALKMDFREICESLGTDPETLEERLLAELGMSGAEVLRRLRECNCVQQRK